MQRALQRNKIQRDEAMGIKTLEVGSKDEAAKAGTKMEVIVKMDKEVTSAAGGIKLSLPIPASPLELAAVAAETMPSSSSSSSCGVLSLPHTNSLDGDKSSDKDNGSDKGDVVCSSGRTSLEGVSDDDGVTGESTEAHPMTA